MKLFYSPGACSLSPHIVSRELGLAPQLVKVDGKTHTFEGGADYYAINVKGSVPALQLDAGEVLTEGAVIVQYLADQKPESGLAPKAGSMDRYRLQEWLNFIATDVHKQMSPLFNPALNPEARTAMRARLDTRLAVVAAPLEKHEYLMGHFTVADAYLFTVLRWAPRLEVELAKWPSLTAFMARMRTREAVKGALTAEGLE
jgi:glutathione S-transferase